MTLRSIHIAFVFCVCIVLCSCGSRTERAAGQTSQREVVLCDSLFKLGMADTLDMGHVFEGETVTKNLIFHNCSGKPVVILSVDTGCGCVEVDYPRSPIQPGRQVNIKVILHSSGLKGDQYKPIAFRTSLSAIVYRTILTAEVKKAE